MSASTHQSTKEKKTKKSTENKQRKTSPTEYTNVPPGFDVQKDGARSKSSSTQPNQENNPQSSYLDKPPGFDKVVTTVTGSIEPESEWPDLTGSEPKKFVEQQKQPFSIGYSTFVSAPFGNLSNDTAFPALGEQTNTLAFPLALDYSSMSFQRNSTHPQYVPPTQPNQLPTDTLALSHQAFPPISVAYPPLANQSTAPISFSTSTTTNTATTSVTKKKIVSPVLVNIRQALGNDKEKFTHFKTLSGWYKNSEITIHEYAAQCSQLFGPSWKDIGPQVAELMPEQAKRKELLSLFKYHQQGVKTTNKSYVQQPPSVWLAAPKAPKNRNVVTMTTPVLNDEDYPTLSAAANHPGPQKVGPFHTWDLSIHS